MFFFIPVSGDSRMDSGTVIPSMNISGETISIDPIGNHSVGDTIRITGITNISDGEILVVEVYPANRTLLPHGVNQSGALDRIRIRSGSDGKNIWEFNFSTSDFIPDTYAVVVSSSTKPAANRSSFTLSGRSSTMFVGDSASQPAETQPAPLTCTIVAIAIGIVVAIGLCRRKRL